MLHHRNLRLLAYNVRSLWNVGSFFRTCDAFAVEKIYLTGYTGYPPRKEITKTAIGAEEYVPWEASRNPVPFVKKLKREGWQIVSLEQTDDAISIEKFTPESKVCIIVGHERDGVPDDLLKLSDVRIEIPMLGNKESLNVAVAVGVALYHIRYEGRTRPAFAPRGYGRQAMNSSLL